MKIRELPNNTRESLIFSAKGFHIVVTEKFVITLTMTLHIKRKGWNMLTKPCIQNRSVFPPAGNGTTHIVGQSATLPLQHFSRSCKSTNTSPNPPSRQTPCLLLFLLHHPLRHLLYNDIPNLHRQRLPLTALIPQNNTSHLH